MGVFDKAKHQAEQLVGKAKEAVGKASDNDKLKRSGQRDQVAGKAKESVQDAKDKAASAVQDLKDKLGGNKD